MIWIKSVQNLEHNNFETPHGNDFQSKVRKPVVTELLEVNQLIDVSI